MPRAATAPTRQDGAGPSPRVSHWIPSLVFRSIPRPEFHSPCFLLYLLLERFSRHSSFVLRLPLGGASRNLCAAFFAMIVCLRDCASDLATLLIVVVLVLFTVGLEIFHNFFHLLLTETVFQRR
jgi:hypothetical protein